MSYGKYIMIPGPTPVVRSIQNQMGREITAFGDPEFIKDYKELIESLKEMWRCEGETFVIAGTGTMAMEMSVANTLKKGDNVLIVSHGYFGDRFIEICDKKEYAADVLQSEWGKIMPVQEIDKKLSEKEYQAIIVSHVDTSTGVRAPIEEIGKVLKKHPNTIYIVDGVCATAAEREYMDTGIDILFTGSQKAFGVCPGLMILWASKKAMERRASLKKINEYYIDFDKWVPIMQDPSKYFATPAINLVWSLLESVRLIQKEGLENRYARHEKVARSIQKALEAVGFSILADPEHRSVALSNILYPENVNDADFRNNLYNENIIVAGGLGAYAGKMFRLGHMGHINLNDVSAVLSGIERVLFNMGAVKETGVILNVFNETYKNL